MVARLSDGPVLARGFVEESPALGFAGGERLSLEAALERSTNEGLSAERLHAHGLLRLFQERYDEAIDDLAAAHLLQPGGSGLAGDLAAAYLARFAVAGDPYDLLAAAEVATEAIDRDPSAPVASYNLALALDGLHLGAGAADAFERYLALDSSSEWAGEARRRLAELHAPTLAERWRDLRERASDVGSSGASLDLDVPPELAFQLLDHTLIRLLPEWADAVDSGRSREAEGLLARIREIGRGLESTSGDATLAQTAEILSRSPTASLDVESFSTWNEGMSLVRENDCAAADDLLARAQGGFRAMSSPLAEWTAYHRAVCAYFDDVPDAAERFQSLRERLLPHQTSFPMLLGRVEWMLGLTRSGSGDWVGALQLHRSALERFRTAGDADGRAGVYAPITEDLEQLGQRREAWRTRLEGLAGVAALGEPKAGVRALSECVPALLADGRPILARLFLNEFLHQARSWPQGGHSVATALLTRAQLARAAGRIEDAEDALAEAEDLAEALPLGPLRSRLTSDIEAERGILQVDLDPREAVSLLSDTLARFERTGYDATTPTLLNARARARLALGDLRGAEGDLERSLRILEERRKNPEDEAVRISYFETFHGAYDDMVRFHSQRPDGARRAFAYADLSRSRALRDRLSAVLEDPTKDGSPRELRLAASSLVRALQAALPENLALVQYSVLPEAVLIWVVRREDFELARYPIAEEELRRQVELFGRALSQGLAAASLRELARPLFEALIGPVRDQIATSSELVIVPDRFLTRLPFAGLVDPSSGRYLVEDHALSFSPSAHLLIAGGGDHRSSDREHLRVLAVAADRFDRSQFPDLSPLPDAAAEVRAVAGLYRDAEVLDGPSATASRFLEGLRTHTVLHFAGHVVSGARRADTMRLALARDPSAPGESELTMTAVDPKAVAGLELAFLSACSTFGVADRSEREGLSGLARELLADGVPAVVGSSWPVADRAARELAVAFHRELFAGTDPAAALRRAQLRLLRRDDASLQDPGSWATFEVYRRSLPDTPRRER